jgi:hypothetical protein
VFKAMKLLNTKPGTKLHSLALQSMFHPSFWKTKFAVLKQISGHSGASFTKCSQESRRSWTVRNT